MAKKLTKSQTIGIAVGCSVAGLALALGLGLGLGLKKDEEEEQPAPPTPEPQPTTIKTYACDPRSGTQYLCSLKEGGPFTAETCDTSDPNCKPCQCVMPVRTTTSAGETCVCGYSDALAADASVPKYNTLSQCVADADQKCGWKYGCDEKDASEYKCSLMPGGQWGTKEECRCYFGEGEEAQGEEGVMGWQCDLDASSPSGCSYVSGGPYKTEAECRCFFAQGNTGPNCTCTRTEANLPTTEARAFNTMEQCTSDTALKCGWLYGCDESSARTCSLKQTGGTWKTQEECVCGPPNLKWSCDPTSTYATKCVQVADDTGQYASQDECRCFECNANSTDDTRCPPVARGAKGTFHSQGDCNCVYAVGEPGPECECKHDPALTASTAEDKKFNSVTLCKQDWKAKCGWKYKCATYGTILQCADQGGQYYLVDGDTETLRLLTDEVAKTYDPDYKTNATYADCSFHEFAFGEPAAPKA